MIWYYLLLFVTTLFNAMFSFLPTVTALPVVNGVNLDLTLSQMVGYFNNFIESFWMIGDVWYGALFLLAYYVLKMVLKLLLGARSPSGHN